MLHEDVSGRIEQDYWSWKRCSERIRKLKGRLGFENSDVLRFLRLCLFLKNGSISDELLVRELSPKEVSEIYCVLSSYSSSNPIELTSKLVSFKQLPGGRLYFKPFRYRVLRPIERVFGRNPKMLEMAGNLLEGTKVDLGDTSIKLRSLPLIPIIIVLWAETDEFPASASFLYDSSIENYLSTEEVVILSELTKNRLMDALQALGKGITP